MSASVVIPTCGRPQVIRLLRTLAAQDPAIDEVIVIDDRPGENGKLPLADLPDGALRGRLRVVRSGGRGPAAARNVGWRTTNSEWVVMLDDDVVPSSSWAFDLAADIGRAGPRVAGNQGQICVPLVRGRRPTDSERATKALEDARWATADMAFRRAALEDVGGFDERFPRAYREDADLALRLRQRDWQLEQGTRLTIHPPKADGPWASLRRQAGNADDALMARIHGRDWREKAETGRGMFRRHAMVTAFAALAATGVAAGRYAIGTGAALAFATGVGLFAAQRISAGPRHADELLAMAATSALIPPLAVSHRLAGTVDAERKIREIPAPRPMVPQAVLLDRDGTLVHDVPYNGDPSRVAPVDGAGRALARLRAAGVRTGVVSNQGGVGLGLLSRAQVQAVNDRVEELLGPLGPWELCFHSAQENCGCRKPEPGMVLSACARLGVDPAHTVVIGDIAADVSAAHAAGAAAVLVPNAQTPWEDVEALGHSVRIAPDIEAAVEIALGGAA